MSFDERTKAAVARVKVIADAIKAPLTGDAALEDYAAEFGYVKSYGDKREWLNEYLSNEIFIAVCRDFEDEREYKKLREAWERKQARTIRREVMERRLSFLKRYASGQAR